MGHELLEQVSCLSMDFSDVVAKFNDNCREVKLLRGSGSGYR